MEDFLPLLKKRVSYLHKQGQNSELPYFLIDFTAEGQAFIRVVDAQKNDFFPDYRLFRGAEFNVLRQLDSIYQDKMLHFSWNEDSKNILLGEHPHLVYQLLRCKNLLSSEGDSINVSSDRAEIRMTLTYSNHRYSPSFCLYTSEEKKENFRFISDIFVCADNVIYPIDSVGENYSMMSFFLSEFDENMLDAYFSIFYSYVENITVEGYTLIFTEENIQTVPTLIFEKVDTDKALYLRLIQALPGNKTYGSQFDLLYQADVLPDKKVVFKRISYHSQEEIAKDLYRVIQSYAPTKSAQRDVYTDSEIFIIPEETATPFLLQGLSTLLKKYQLMGVEKLQGYKVKPVSPKLDIHLSSGIDFLEGEADILLEDEKMTLKDFFARIQKNKYVILSDGNRAIVEEGYIRKLEHIFKKGKGKKSIRISFFDLPEIEELLSEASLSGNQVLNHHRSIYEGFNKLHEQTLKLPKVNAELRDYQKEGVKWINYLYENNLGGCLADDMGLGKTLQTITMLAKIYPKVKQPTLLVMPKSLLFNWQSEIRKFAPQLKVYTYYGTDRDLEKAMKYQLILTTYAMVRNDIEAYMKAHFHYVILDESQNIKNISAQVTQAVLLLKAEHRLALSGTPIENNLTELYSLFRFLNPSMFGSLEDFNSRYTYPIQKNNDKEAMAALSKKIFPFMLRRLKKNVLKELPDRIEQVLYVEMEKEHAAFYEERRRFYYRQVKQTIAEEGVQKSQFVMFQALNELRRIASVPESMSEGRIASPKLDLLLNALSEAVENGHKVVVFFNYIAGIELVGEKLNELGIDFTSMTGSTHDRKGVVDRFQNDPNCKVMLMTLKTGGVGLNLTVADTVFVFEPWWNKAAEEQAINRLHRFGQKSNVLSYSIITRGSIEEKIALLQQQKADLFAGLIGSDASSAKHLSEEDINFILG